MARLASQFIPGNTSRHLNRGGSPCDTEASLRASGAEILVLAALGALIILLGQPCGTAGIPPINHGASIAAIVFPEAVPTRCTLWVALCEVVAVDLALEEAPGALQHDEVEGALANLACGRDSKG